MRKSAKTKPMGSNYVRVAIDSDLMVELIDDAKLKGNTVPQHIEAILNAYFDRDGEIVYGYNGPTELNPKFLESNEWPDVVE